MRRPSSTIGSAGSWRPWPRAWKTDGPVGGDAWQSRIFTLAKADDLPARDAFEAIYRAFLGRPNGPRAGWLLASLDPAFVVGRARDAASMASAGSAS